jgi:hypothetical protein
VSAGRCRQGACHEPAARATGAAQQPTRAAAARDDLRQLQSTFGNRALGDEVRVLEAWLAEQDQDEPALIRRDAREEAERRLAEQPSWREEAMLALGGRAELDRAQREPSPGIANLPRRTRRVPTIEFFATNIEKGFGQAVVTGTTSIVQSRPDPTAGYAFNCFLLNETTGALIPATHLGGTRFRVLAGTPECPGCHFGNGLVVDLQGEHFAALAGQMILDVAGAIRRPPGTQRAPQPPPGAPSRPTPGPRTPPPQTGGAGRTAPVVVETAGGTATTAGGTATVRRGPQPVVDLPVGGEPARTAALPDTATGPQRPVTATPDVTPGVDASWTVDPDVVVDRARAAGYQPVPTSIPPVPDVSRNLAALRWALTGARPRDETPFVLPGAELPEPRVAPGNDEAPRLLPGQDPGGPALLPGPWEEGSEDRRELPGAGRAPFSSERDPLAEYFELAGTTKKKATAASSRRDRRLQDLHELQIAEYREHTFADRRDDALEGHEITQNLWLRLRGYTSERGTGRASRWNPTIALPPEVHHSVSAYQAALGLFDHAAVKRLGYQEMLDLNELALREGLRDHGYAQATIDRVVEKATQEAWEHAIFTIARGKRRR